MTECYNILLVDDSEDDKLLIHNMLRKANPCHKLTWINSYDEALSAIQNDVYDVLLFDYRLGTRTGVDLLQEPIVQGCGHPVILLTGQGSEDIDEAALQAGASDYLIKHEITGNLLIRTIRYAIRHAQALHELRQSETRYRAIVDEQTEFLIRFRPDGTLTFVNEAYCHYRHLSRDELLGTHYLETVDDNDHASLLETLEIVSQYDTTGVREVQAISENGVPVWHTWTTRAIRDEKQTIVEYQSVIRDISDRKAIEEALQARIHELKMLRRVDDELTGTLQFDQVIDLAIDSAMRLSGGDTAILALYDPQDRGLTIERSIGVAELKPLQVPYREQRGVLQQVITNRQTVCISDVKSNPDALPTRERTRAQMVIPLQSQDNLLGLISLETRFPERFNNETVDFLNLVTVRIAAAIDNARLYNVQKEQLEELQGLYKQITELEQLKTDMIHIASHDLRNPIGVLQGYIEILRWDMSQSETPDPEKISSHLSAMEKAIRRMQKITTDILSLERINRTAKLSEEQIDLSWVIMDVVDEHRQVAESKGLTYLTHVPGVPTFIRGDHAQLREAAANLITNAIKYTPEGGMIDIQLEYDGDAAVFEVTDTGYGIPFEKQDKLFKPFYRAKTRETLDIEGTGLGLHLVKNIVERHQGRMIFRSRYREGSTFGFQIPTSS